MTYSETDQLTEATDGAAPRQGPDIFADALRESLREFPYNSASQFYKYFEGHTVASSYGAACVNQSFDAAERAHERGAARATFLRDGRHVAAVFDDEGDLVVLDPYLLHLDPLRFPRNEIDDGKSVAHSKTAPPRTSSLGETKAGLLTASYRGTESGYLIRLKYRKYSPAQGKYMLSRHFTLRSGSEITPDLPAEWVRKLLIHPEQTSLSMRVLNGNLTRMTEAILPLEGFADRSFSDDDIWLRNTDGVMLKSGSPIASSAWDELEASGQLSRSEISEHLVSASEIYRRVARSDVALDPYPTEDE